MDPATGLREGEALHFACAIGAGVQSLVTLDLVFAKNAKRMKVKAVPIKVAAAVRLAGLTPRRRRGDRRQAQHRLVDRIFAITRAALTELGDVV